MVSFVLKALCANRNRPILAANSLIRNSPASEERSPPAKFILTRLLLSRDVVFKMFTESSFSWLFVTSTITFYQKCELFFVHLSDESNNRNNCSSYAAFSRVVPIGMNNSGLIPVISAPKQKVPLPHQSDRGAFFIRIYSCGNMILFTTKKITMDTPPFKTVVPML